MKSTRLPPMAALIAASAFLCAFATAGDAPGLAGQKLDSGLGTLPHYSLWGDRTGGSMVADESAGQKLDSGLGELPHYNQWTDRSGRASVTLATR